MSILRRAIPSRRLLSTGPFAQRTRQRAWNQLNKRSYASDGHQGEHKHPSDIPWAITSVVVTIPVASWIWSQGEARNKPGEGGHHGHDDHSKDDSHDAEEAGSEESEESKNEAKDAAEEDSKAESEDKKNDSKPDAKEQDKPEEDAEKDTEKDSNKKSDSDSESGDESKDTPATSDDEDSEKDKELEKAETPKAATAAMHKGKPHEDKSISKKSEGVHDTAKLTETVDPFRPAK